MDIKKIFKGLDKTEAQAIINQASLTLEELALANSLFIDNKPRLYFCDDYGCSLSKYHNILNRVIVKLESCVKFKLFAK